MIRDYIETLTKLIDERDTAYTDRMKRGDCKDHAAYRETVGKLAGLREVRDDLIQDAAKRYEDDE